MEIWAILAWEITGWLADLSGGSWLAIHAAYYNLQLTAG